MMSLQIVPDLPPTQHYTTVLHNLFMEHKDFVKTPAINKAKVIYKNNLWLEVAGNVSSRSRR
jgi:hypothetical protein